MLSRTFFLALGASSFLSHLAIAGDIRWETSLETALARAKAESKIVFIAANMEGEGANERMAKNTYHADEIFKLAAETVNVIASPSDHTPAGKPCTVFKTLTCAEHKAVALEARKNALKPDANGNVVAPQHVFLDSNGAPLLAVPYEITTGELAWCFAAARKRANPAGKVALASSARMPRRAVIGALYDPSSALGGAVQPVTKKELLELIDQVKRGIDSEEGQTRFRRILHSDLPEAIAFITAELRSGGVGTEKHADILHAMGAVSPIAYWELAAEFLGRDEVVVRSEAAVALEQMGAPAAVKLISDRLGKEKDRKVAKDQIRALAACGASDPKVRAQLVQRLKKEKDDLLRRNTITALGLLDEDKDVRAALIGLLETGSEGEKIAAACAMALSRDETYLPSLTSAKAASPPAALALALNAASDVLNGAGLSRIQMTIWNNCEDQIPRERTFGKSTR